MSSHRQQPHVAFSFIWAQQILLSYPLLAHSLALVLKKKKGVQIRKEAPPPHKKKKKIQDGNVVLCH